MSQNNLLTLTNSEKRALKAKAHKLQPVILLGNKGLTQAVFEETDRALETHELIKVKIPVEDRDLRREVAAKLCEATRAALVQLIGHIAVLYRPEEKK